MFIQSIETIVTLLGIILIGALIGNKHWFKGGVDIFSKFLTTVVLPASVCKTAILYFGDIDDLSSFMKMAFCVTLIFFAVIALGILLAKVFKIQKNRIGVFTGAVSFPNVILLGFPIIENIFGTQLMKYAVIYLIPNTIIFWSVGTYLLMKYGEDSNEAKIFSMKSLKGLFSPSFIALIVSIIVVSLKVQVPEILTKMITQIAGASTAVSMIFIGAVIREAFFDKKDKENMARDIGLAMFSKLIIFPVIIALIIKFSPVPSAAKPIFFILSMGPMSVNYTVLAHQYKCDFKFGALLSSVMNLSCIASIPIYVYIMEHFAIF